MADGTETPELNKHVVVRFNKEVIEAGSDSAFRELVAEEFLNRTAPPGTASGPDGMAYFLNRVLRPALPDLQVEIHDQIAESNKVATRKTIHGTLRGALLGVAPTHQRVAIDVFDIVRLDRGRYVEHWAVSTLPALLASLRHAT